MEIQPSLVLAGFIIQTGLDIFAILEIHTGLVILASIIHWTGLDIQVGLVTLAGIIHWTGLDIQTDLTPNPTDQFVMPITHTHLPQKNVNSIQFDKRIVHVNHALIPGSPILKEKA